jgi:SAM-dependent MidA family methyltransferase
VKDLRRKIEQEIGQRGPIRFSRYMEICLYDPEFGYYARNAEQFGKAGDFYTSSDLHAVFGRLMARQFEEMWRILGRPERLTLAELGPGRGFFARDVLDWAEKKFPDFFRAVSYVLVERSPALREKIAQTLNQRIESGKAELALIEEGASGTDAWSSIGSIGATEVAPFQTWALSTCHSPIIVFANEFFDAFPVEIVSTQGSLRIATKDGRFVESWVPSCPEELEFLDRYAVHPENSERIEIGLAARRYGEDLFRRIERGFFVSVDYGYTREEQLAGRHRGTLKAIRQHSMSANPYEAPGEQDITADVNFTALAAAAERHGWHTEKLVTQSQFLMGIGEANQFADAFEDCRFPQERTKVALQLKHLVTPAGMGESFHALVASRGVQPDLAASLAGLGFGRTAK